MGQTEEPGEAQVLICDNGTLSSDDITDTLCENRSPWRRCIGVGVLTNNAVFINRTVNAMYNITISIIHVARHNL